MLVILDRQHHGKPARDDRGASSGDLVEVELTEAYINAAADILRHAGLSVLVLEWGLYSARHEYARAVAAAVPGPVAYVACHVNAGGGSYGLSCYDSRSRAGKGLSDCIADDLATLTGSARSEPASPDKWSNAYHTIKGCYEGPANLSGCCFEPGFIDSEAHRWLWYADGLVRVGEALAAGVLAWMED